MHPDPQRGRIGDRDPLRQEYAPETIRHRDGEVTALTSLLSPTTAGGITKTALVYGPPGSGKTLTTTTVLNEVHRDYNVPTVAVDCWTEHRPSRALYAVLEGLAGETTADPENTSPGALAAKIDAEVSEPTIVFLDEADKLTDDRVMRDLFEISEIRLVFAANKRHQVVGNLEPQTYSRIGTTQDIEFEKYHDHELVSILEDRLTAARVEPGLVDGDALEEIADAGERDARKAIATLRNALDAALLQERQTVTAEIIEQAAVDAEKDIAHARISSLTGEQVLVLEAIYNCEPATSGTIHEAFCEHSPSDEPAVGRTVRGWLSEKFPQYNLVRTRADENPVEYELTDVARSILE